MYKKIKEKIVCCCHPCEHGTLFLSVVLLITLLTGLLFLIAAPKKYFSEEENRSLEKEPLLSIENVLDGSFMTAAENYVGDHFMLRKQFIEIHTVAQYGFGRRDLASNYANIPAEGGVYFGKDDHVYEVLLPNQNGVFTGNIKAFRYFAKKSSLPFYILPVPSGSQEQPQNLPPFAPNHDQREELNALKSISEKNVKVVDVFNTLSSSSGQDYYYKTDHHWNIFGAYQGYRALVEAMNINPVSQNKFDFKPASTSFLGTLYSKALAPWQQPDTLYLPLYKQDIQITQQTGTQKKQGLYWEEYLDKKDKYSTFLGGNHSVDLVRNPQGKEGKLLILKDSFANSMIPFLAVNFSEIHILDLRYYNQNVYEYIEKNKIDRVAAIYSIKQLSDVSVAGKLTRGKNN